MDNNSFNDISDIIKRIRVEHRLSQHDFAERLEISLRTVQNWEYKQSSPTRANIQRMVKEFDLKKEDYPELFSYVAAPKPDEHINGAKKEAALSESETSEKNGEGKKSFFKKFFNSPLKVVLCSIIGLLAILGAAIVLYFCYSAYHYGTVLPEYVAIPIACVVAAAIAIPLAVYFLLKRRKK